MQYPPQHPPPHAVAVPPGPIAEDLAALARAYEACGAEDPYRRLAAELRGALGPVAGPQGARAPAPDLADVVQETARLADLAQSAGHQGLADMLARHQAELEAIVTGA